LLCLLLTLQIAAGKQKPRCLDEAAGLRKFYFHKSDPNYLAAKEQQIAK
jgi:hypothetical protein